MKFFEIIYDRIESRVVHITMNDEMVDKDAMDEFLTNIEDYDDKSEHLNTDDPDIECIAVFELNPKGERI